MRIQSKKALLLASSLTFIISGCSSTPETIRKTGEYSFYDSTLSFISLNDTRSNGAVVDKGVFYPKSAYSFTYRYCSTSEQNAQNDIAEYQDLAKRVCDANAGQLIHQPSGTWCVSNANTFDERPIFSARISSTALWADLCLDGPFVTLKVTENTTAPQDEWYQSAQILGYQPYHPQRQLVSPAVVSSTLYQAPTTSGSSNTWSDESQFIYSNVGATVCIYDHPQGAPSGYTYRGQVHSVNSGMVKVLATEKLQGDIRTAPAFKRLEWHREAYITASASSWFVCS
ncbi:hypothetical protein C9I98_02450 [Photobacterium sanctipauli]|uniref:Uncharacterized protein n=1 Tax=Photobacterium sanctipauli TaxID=1342794 RepID=A0A2T3P0U5_9GAMM|nr:hypothetical protein [Photobacterium sanctipauli]PSW22146.1 hypothetical protein C9I98_02450 [Photobacterium sanctipauli]